MRPGSPNGAARARARSGIAPALLLDVQTPSGTIFYWSDRRLTNVPGMITSDGSAANVGYEAWLLGSGSMSYNRSTVTDTGTVVLQNLSGDVLQSDWERIVNKTTLEGALFVLRWYQLDLEWAWIEQHGTLSVGDTTRPTVTLNLQQLMQGSDDTPDQIVSETCQLDWGKTRCGATGTAECLYNYASCQVPLRFTGIQTAFETNNPATAAQLPTQTINRKRAW